MKRLIALAAGAMLLGGSTAHALSVPTAPRCPVFPATNAWNERVDTLPVAANSAQLIQSIGLTNGLSVTYSNRLWATRILINV